MLLALFIPCHPCSNPFIFGHASVYQDVRFILSRSKGESRSGTCPPITCVQVEDSMVKLTKHSKWKELNKTTALWQITFSRAYRVLWNAGRSCSLPWSTTSVKASTTSIASGNDESTKSRHGRRKLRPQPEDSVLPQIKRNSQDLLEKG